MRILRSLALAALAAELLLAGGTPVTAQPRTRAVIVSWDGAHARQINELLRAGKLPNLARLIAGGVFADSVMTAFPAETAPGFASLWTGADPRTTEISGNLVPRTPKSAHTILQSVSGFSSAALAAEPLWRSAARSGYRTVVLQATHAWPFDSYTADGTRAQGSGNLILFEGFAGAMGQDGVVTGREVRPMPANGWKNIPPSAAEPREIAFAVGNATLYGLLIDDPADAANGYDTMMISQEKDGRQIKAALKSAIPEAGNLDPWSSTLELKDMKGAGVRLRLFDLKPDGSNYLLYFTRPMRELSTHRNLLPQLRNAAGVFIGNGASLLYLHGALGRPIFRGGDGTAELRYLETVALSQRQTIKATIWAMRTLSWDLLLTYTPYPDEAEHLWRGFLEPALPGFRRDVAERLRGFMEAIYAGCDGLLGEVLRSRPQNTILALVSDHGMEGVSRAVRINLALKRAGLLVLDGKGRVDLSRTKALYPATDNAYILINTTDRKQGIVPLEERAQVVEEIRAALKQVQDLGHAVVTDVFDAETEGRKMGIGGNAGGDVYLDLAPGYSFDANLRSGDWIVSREPYGTHSFNPARSSMRTIMMFYGPGVAAGRKLERARASDFAPTLARLLGIATPRAASGRVLEEALGP
ncbi:MAG: alkaline phosphatase family protein [Candidatus Binatia bacterium]